jgi:hypothetical protein
LNLSIQSILLLQLDLSVLLDPLDPLHLWAQSIQLPP